jgi:hypothetical protein
MSDDKRLMLLEDRFIRHMEIEERTLKMLTENSEHQNQKIDSIIDAINDIKGNMHTSALTYEIRCAKERDGIRTEMSEKYATKQELNDSLASIRNSAKLLWATIATMATVSVWVFEKLS